MTNSDKHSEDHPVTVTGEELAHPSIRLLARACIELARQKITSNSEPLLEAAPGAPVGVDEDGRNA